jgi:NAD(P)-dependent dehydrogenase (short-subunit alcohol dehydrogenase family)/acyl carrier protein
VLTTRSPFPPRRDWEGWLARHGEQDHTSQRIRELLAVEAAGGEVMVAAADVADERAMTAVIEETHRRFGAIHGVVHAAGILQPGLIEEKTREAVEAVLAPKVRGTRILAELTAPDRPDFLLLCSSMNSIVGVVGSMDYCAANAFLDAYATSVEAKGGGRVVSVAWDSWQQVGMALNEAIPEHMRVARAAYLQDSIRNEEGLEALRRIFGASLNCVGVIPRDLPGMLSQAEAAARRTPAARGGIAESGASGAASAGEDPEHNGFSPTQQHIAGIWKEMLGVGEIRLDDNFFELGGHSLLGTSVLSRIRKQYGVGLPLRTLFEAPTVRQIADHVDTLLWASQGVNGSPGADSEEREEIEL